MEIIEAIILGVIQGLTEFLPVSSSGHLEIAKKLFEGTPNPKDSMLMTVVLHFATALSTCVVFKKEIFSLIKGVFEFKKNEQTLYVGKIILSMIPAAAVGFLFDEQIEAFFSGNLILVGTMLLVTAILLFISDKAKSTDKEVSFFDAIVVGIAQAIAILPGISRSGSTISTSVILGIDRKKAAQFSFLMVIPLILGKMAKDLLDGELGSINSELAFSLGIGFVTAFIVGIVACRWMIAIVRNSKLTYFAIYCLMAGITAITISTI